MNLTFEPVKGIRYAYEYGDIQRELEKCFKAEDEEGIFTIVREMVVVDLWFLLFFVLGIGDINSPWLTERVYEVQADCEGTIDLWPRGHYKSSLISYGRNIQRILRDPEQRICILSYIRAMSKSILRRIKTTFESNEYLKGAFSNVLYENPKVQSPKWTEDEGIIVQRRGVYSDSTVEAWGLIDSMPTGKHFTHLCIDDAVERGTVASPEQIRKTMTALYEAESLLDVKSGTKCMVGTHWSHADPYTILRKSGVYKERIWGPFWTREDEDSWNYDKLTVFTKEQYLEKCAKLDDYTRSCQISNRPSPSSEIKFKMEWIKYWREKPYCNVYIVVDPASTKKTTSDYTVMIVYGVNAYRNFMVLDMIRDKLGLREKWEKLRDLVDSWQPLTVGYEQYAMQSDVEYMLEQQENEGIYFDIQPLAGGVKKEDRIRALIAYFQTGRIAFPRSLSYITKTGESIDPVSTFIDEEFTKWPFGEHDDIMDALSRMMDTKMGIVFPNVKTPEWGNPLESHRNGSWMSA